MASPQEHKTKWLRNREFLKTIDENYPEWMVVVMFYTALHAVETLFRVDGTNPHVGHDARNRTLKNVNRYKKVWENYRVLFDASRSARYDVEASDWIPAEDVKGKLASRLYALEKSVLKLIGSDDTLEPIW